MADSAIAAWVPDTKNPMDGQGHPQGVYISLTDHQIFGYLKQITLVLLPLMHDKRKERTVLW